jgi:hypothetical protein
MSRPILHQRTSLGHNRTECQRDCVETCRQPVTKAADEGSGPTAIYFRVTRHRIRAGVSRSRKALPARRPMWPPKR